MCCVFFSLWERREKNKLWSHAFLSPRVPVPVIRRVIPVIPLTFRGFTKESRFLSHGKPKKESRVRLLLPDPTYVKAKELEVRDKRSFFRAIARTHYNNRHHNKILAFEWLGATPPPLKPLSTILWSPLDPSLPHHW